MQNDLKLLNLMLEDQKNERTLYKPSSYWSYYSRRISNAIREDGLKTFRSNSRIGKGYADTASMDPFELLANDSLKHKVHKYIRNNGAVKKYFLDPYIKQNRSYFQQAQNYRNLHYTDILGPWYTKFSKEHSLPDTLVGEPQDTVTINGQKIGFAYLGAFLRIFQYSKHVDFSKIESVFEIGGGFGAFAHTLLHLYPNIKKFVYLDIPPIVYVGTQYLKHFYPDEVLDYSQTRKLQMLSFEPDNKRKIVAICPWQIENLDTKIDLFWNSASFQEMTPAIVENYGTHIGRLMNKNSKLCFMAYKKGDPNKTIMPDELSKILRENTSFKLKEVKAETNTLDEHYFIGSRDNS
jgi:putative sugar O-methyltransferase